MIRSDSIALITVMCNTLAEGMQFYVGQLGFVVKCDEEVDGERFVVAAPPNLTEFAPQSALRFREARTQRDRAAVGNQAGDGIFLQVETDDWDKVYEKLKAMGARILDPEPRRRENRYKAVTVMDNMGNRVNLINKTTTALGRVFSMDVGR